MVVIFFFLFLGGVLGGGGGYSALGYIGFNFYFEGRWRKKSWNVTRFYIYKSNCVKIRCRAKLTLRSMVTS